MLLSCGLGALKIKGEYLMEIGISIFGLGYVGTVSLGCLSAEGHRVIGVDIDPNKLDLVRKGISPIIEEGVCELIAETVKNGRMEVTDDVAYAVHNTEISFVCVGTPSATNGSQDLGALKRITTQIGDALKEKTDYHVVVIRSTVPPGTVSGEIKTLLEDQSGKKVGEHFGLCFQPEFLREGSSIKDYRNPPFTVIGGDSERSVEKVHQIFSHLPCEFVSTSIKAAEMLKYCCNVFHAVKITFANEVGRLCQALDVDAHEVMDLVCRDKHLNISPAYLKPGFAFGGSCLPKDLQGLLYLAKSRDVELPMLSHVLPSNSVHIGQAINIVLGFGKRSIGMLGLSFKSGTDDLRNSPLVVMAEHLIGKGMNLKIFDPEVNLARISGANRNYIENAIPHISSLMVSTCEEAVEGSEVVILGLPDEAIIKSLHAVCRPDHAVVDLVGTKLRGHIAGKYYGLCW
jgi:GDP-mannose 6-dehydrogenase